MADPALHAPAAPAPAPGVDAMLDQVSAAVLRAARHEILPEVQRDRAMQREIGAAAGLAAARKLRWPVLLLASAAMLGASAYAYHTWSRERRWAREDKRRRARD